MIFGLPAIVALALSQGAGPAADLRLQLVADVPLGGNTTRLDYASLDADRHLLFIAHLGDSAVIVFDTRSRRVVSRIGGVNKVHGVLAIPSLARVYASATGDNEVVAIDEASLQVSARMPGGIYPDGMAYAPEARKLYVSDEHGASETVIDTTRNQRIATIALGGDVGNTQYDESSKHIFVNVQTRAQLVEIDPATDQIIARIELPGARGNHGLLIDAQQRRAFIACEDNQRLLVLDLATRKIVQTFKVGEDPDVLAYDPQLHRLYVAGEAGVVSLFQAGADTVSRLGEGFIGANAHVVAVDPAMHEVFFPLRDVGHRAVLRIMQAQP